MYLLAEMYHIKPWEYNETHEVYYEDIQALLSIKRIIAESHKKESRRENKMAGLRDRAAKAWGADN